VSARGLVANPAGTALYGVFGDSLFSIASTGVRTRLGTLVTSRGPVGMKMGLTQLVIVDGAHLYVYDMVGRVFGQHAPEGWLGSFTVEYLGGYFSFIDPNSQTFYTSAIEDATTISALDFEDAQALPDKLVGQVTTGGVIAYMGEVSGEIWQDSGEPSPGVPFSRNSGSFIEFGLMAAHSIKAMDNSAFWLGRDQRGAGTVYKLENFRAVRVSTAAVEQKIQTAIRYGNDVSQSIAYAYQQDGHTFYCLQVPGLDTTWCYDAASQQWHERVELVGGEYQQHRGQYHAYCYGRHLITGADELIYEYDPEVSTNAGDILVRDRVSPHYATPMLEWVDYGAFQLDCTVGKGIAGHAQANVMLRYSNDGGNSWSSWRTATLGAVGQYQARARFLRCGSGRDRIWEVRCTDDVPLAIINAAIEAHT
jgi:hypothetical protein